MVTARGVDSSGDDGMCIRRVAGLWLVLVYTTFTKGMDRDVRICRNMTS
jgi:hypothetical protein